MSDLRAPFPWFGGKSRVAHLVWDAFGDCANYVEPFAGSLAVLLGRPSPPRIETVNDLDCYLSNFWRAVAFDPAAVAHHADWPVNEADLHARHLWLVNSAEFRERMKSDPDFYDVKRAGWWVWGLSAWLGSGWCDVPANEDAGGGSDQAGRSPTPAVEASTVAATAVPQRRRHGRQPSRQIPWVGGGGVECIGKPPSRQLPELYWSKGVHSSVFGGSFDALSARLRRVRVCCGSWERVLTDSVTIHVGDVTGVFLDPPYTDGNVDYAVGGAGGGVANAVREWALEHGDNSRLRVALCGYEGEHAMPESWRCVPWKAKGGYANTRKDGENVNAGRERIWFSPHCLGARQPDLFAGAFR